jgi:hypothetical protein
VLAGTLLSSGDVPGAMQVAEEANGDVLKVCPVLCQWTGRQRVAPPQAGGARGKFMVSRYAQDARLLFALKRQEFVEHLRRGDMVGRKQALGAHPAACLSHGALAAGDILRIAFTHLPGRARRPSCLEALSDAVHRHLLRCTPCRLWLCSVRAP